MTADPSWYGQQTLVHPDSSHQPYAPYDTYETYGDPYATHQQYGYVQQHGYAAPYGYGEPYGGGHTATATQPAAGYGWPDYYQAQHEPTLVAEYGGYPGHAAHQAHQGYAAHHGYAAYPESPGYANHGAYPDYSVYDTETDGSYAAGIAPQPWDGSDGVDAGCEAHERVGPADDGPDPDVGDDTDAVAGGRGGLGADDADRCEVAQASRRRGVRRRSAVLTIAVPSLAVLGVAGAAAATMGPLRSHHTDATASSSTAATQAKAQALAASEARDAAQRAARDQARTALQLRQAAARKAAAEAPRYVLPIAYHTGLSALFGQAGTHWMQLHTGIDFPVPEGTPVHAVTGGTVTTEWNPFYGYMVKLTAPDGTVTWYCHLSSYRVRSGQVKVGDIIAYSGDTGNSTGPHLHFEVHPDGGPAVDPLPWLLARGLDPR
ncbi:M23 family metallopeptidase [Streptacidiphilus melanogenes]|uniref:M23 family metallopeptidase n=1 Tax=Streptacidiphilus melanogenes TaxID=411235 RepID=UPI0006949F10|nr:M23 family metallopeptidase [Streptacidiphilus melanogenes]